MRPLPYIPTMWGCCTAVPASIAKWKNGTKLCWITTIFCIPTKTTIRLTVSVQCFWYNKKRYSEAYADYAKLEELKPNLPDGLMGKALIAKMEQKWPEAEEIYTTLTYRYKGRGDLYAHRAECYLHLNKLAHTQQDIEKAISLNYTDPYVYVLRGQLRLKQYDKGAAVKDFLQAKSLGYNPSVIDEYIRSAGKKP